jgi:aspartyl-tRNA(Asn)/glutamyl-tRNA(Gln) amidotransferase subunit A
MIDPKFTVAGIRDLLDRRETTSRELVAFFLDCAEKSQGSIRAFLSLEPEQALRAARESDSRRAQGHCLSPLDGVPLAIKDILCTREGSTTCGSRMLQNYRSPFDAHVVSQLHRSGAIWFGKTNLDEFAMGGSTETGFWGASHNPWDLQRTCGGSSGGSAAAVSAGLAPAALGTDTGGSIRQPAAFCGVCGIKPTYGRVSRYGLIAYGSSLDVAGVFAHSVEDLALVLERIAGHDPRDSTSLDAPVPEYSQAIRSFPRSLRIGIIREHLESEGLDPELKQSILNALDVFRSLGATVSEVSMPHARYSIPTYYIVAPCEASSNLARYDGAHYGYRWTPDASASGHRAETTAGSPLDAMYERTRSLGLGTEVRRRILLGTYALSAGYYDAYYRKALQVRRLIRQDYDSAFEGVDLLLGPTTPHPAFALGEKTQDPVQLYLEDLFTVGANLAGIPAMSIPCGQTRAGLPLGMQLQAPALQEGRLLAAGHAFEQRAGGERSLPPIAREWLA